MSVTRHKRLFNDWRDSLPRIEQGHRHRRDPRQRIISTAKFCGLGYPGCLVRVVTVRRVARTDGGSRLVACCERCASETPAEGGTP